MKNQLMPHINKRPSWREIIKAIFIALFIGGGTLLLVLGALLFSRKFSNVWLNDESNTDKTKKLNHSTDDLKFTIISEQSQPPMTTQHSLATLSPPENAPPANDNEDVSNSFLQTLGGENKDRGNSLGQDSNSNIFSTGYTESTGQGNKDTYIAKHTPEGQLLWPQTFGTPSREASSSLLVLRNDDLITTGYTDSSGNGDIFIVRFNNDGGLVWERVLTGWSNWDRPLIMRSLIESNNGDIHFFGKTKHSNGDGTYDLLIDTLDKHGEPIGLARRIGGPLHYLPNSVSPTNNNTAIVSIRKYEDGGNMVILECSLSSTKLPLAVEITLGSSVDSPMNAIKIADDLIFIVGTTKNTLTTPGIYRSFIMNYNPLTGNSTCCKAFFIEGSIGNSAFNAAYSVIEDGEGKFIVAGQASNADGNIAYVMRATKNCQISDLRVLHGAKFIKQVQASTSGFPGFLVIGETNGFSPTPPSAFLAKLTQATLQLATKELEQPAFTTEDLTPTIAQFTPPVDEFISQPNATKANFTFDRNPSLKHLSLAGKLPNTPSNAPSATLAPNSIPFYTSLGSPLTNVTINGYPIANVTMSLASQNLNGKGSDNTKVAFVNGTNTLTKNGTFNVGDYLNLLFNTADNKGNEGRASATLYVHNTPPSAPAWNNVKRLLKNAPIGTGLGTAESTDPDANATITYRITTGSEYIGITDKGKTSLKQSLDDFADDAITFGIVAIDEHGGESPETLVTMAIVRPAQPVYLGPQTFPEGKANRTVGCFYTYNPIGNPIRVIMDLDAYFQMQNDTCFKTITDTEYDNLPPDGRSVSGIVTGIDTIKLTQSKPTTFTVTFTSVNKPPSSLSLNTTYIARNLTGQWIGLSATDLDKYDKTFTYALINIPNVTCSDNKHFKIDKNRMGPIHLFNASTPNILTPCIQVTDKNNGTFSKSAPLDIVDGIIHPSGNSSSTTRVPASEQYMLINLKDSNNTVIIPIIVDGKTVLQYITLWNKINLEAFKSLTYQDIKRQLQSKRKLTNTLTILKSLGRATNKTTLDLTDNQQIILDLAASDITAGIFIFYLSDKTMGLSNKILIPLLLAVLAGTAAFACFTSGVAVTLCCLRRQSNRKNKQTKQVELSNMFNVVPHGENRASADWKSELTKSVHALHQPPKQDKTNPSQIYQATERSHTVAHS